MRHRHGFWARISTLNKMSRLLRMCAVRHNQLMVQRIINNSGKKMFSEQKKNKIPSKNSKIRNMKSRFLDITKNMFQQICVRVPACRLNYLNCVATQRTYEVAFDIPLKIVPSFDDSVSFCERQWGVFGRDGETPASPASTSPSTTDAKPRWRTNDPGGSELSSVQLIGAGSQSITANTAQTLVYINPPKSGPILSTWIIQPVCKVPVASIIHANT